LGLACVDVLVNCPFRRCFDGDIVGIDGRFSVEKPGEKVWEPHGSLRGHLHDDLAARCVLCGGVAVAAIYGAEGIGAICPMRPCTCEWISASADSKEGLVG